MKMRLFTLYTILTISVVQAQDTTTIISPPTAEHSGCDLAVAGINKEKFLIFFSKLKDAASSKSSDAMSLLIIYPLRVNASKSKKEIKNPDELKKNFSTVFNPKILDTVSKQEIKNLFCRDQGAMFGDGEIWVNQENEKVGISTINL